MSTLEKPKPNRITLPIPSTETTNPLFTRPQPPPTTQRIPKSQPRQLSSVAAKKNWLLGSERSRQLRLRLTECALRERTTFPNSTPSSTCTWGSKTKWCCCCCFFYSFCFFV